MRPAPAPSSRPTVVVTRKLPGPVEDRLEREFAARLNRDDHPFTAPELQEALRGADALLPTVTDRITTEVLSVEPLRARILANFGVGYNHIDMHAAKARGLVVTNTPEVLTDDTADDAVMLMLMVARRAGEAERHVRSRQWTGWRPTHMLGTKVSGKTLGLVGMGVLREADFVSLHCPATPETRHLIDTERLALMKPTAFLINTARGDIVDEAALVAALKEQRIAGAALDVYEREPQVTPDLLTMENVVLLPHLGSATQETRVAMGLRALENLQAFFSGAPPRDRVV